MAAQTDPNSGIKHSWGDGFNGWGDDMDANLKLIARAGFHLAVIDKDLTAPPGSPADGVRYIIAAGATGAWAGKDNQLAVYDAALVAWVFYVPSEGWSCWAKDENARYDYTGAAWILAASGGGGSVLDDFKDSVRVATTANITLSGEQTIDGVLTSLDRVLVKDQTVGSENGIYTTAAGAWTRADDFDEDSEVTAGAIVPVEEGTAGGDILWILATNDPIVVGTSALTFSGIAAGAGEANTGVNIGAGGVGVFKQKTGANLEFKNINAGSGKITITDDTVNGEVDIDINEAALTVTESQISDLQSYLLNLAEDTTPQLGGDLDLNGSNITEAGSASLDIVKSGSGDINLTNSGTGDINLNADVNVTGTVDGRDLAADGTKLDAIEIGATADQTGGEIKIAYEGEANTNAFTDAEKSKLAQLLTGANKTDATAAPTANDDSSNTSGNGVFEVGSRWVDVTGDEAYQCLDATPTAAVWAKTTLSTSELAAVALSGQFSDMIGSITTAQITNSNVTLAKLADMATGSLLGRSTAGTGVPEVLSAATARTLLGLIIGTDVQAYDVDTAKLDADQDWTGSQRSPLSAVTNGTLDLDTANNYDYTPAAADILEFTNEAAGQSGHILLNNPSGYAISLGAEVEAETGAATALSAAGTYLVFYSCHDGINVGITYSAAIA